MKLKRKLHGRSMVVASPPKPAGTRGATRKKVLLRGHTRTHARCILLGSEEDNAAARAALRFHALKHALPIVEHLRVHCHLLLGRCLHSIYIWRTVYSVICNG